MQEKNRIQKSIFRFSDTSTGVLMYISLTFLLNIIPLAYFYGSLLINVIFLSILEGIPINFLVLIMNYILPFFSQVLMILVSTIVFIICLINLNWNNKEGKPYGPVFGFNLEFSALPILLFYSLLEIITLIFLNIDSMMNLMDPHFHREVLFVHLFTLNLIFRGISLIISIYILILSVTLWKKREF